MSDVTDVTEVDVGNTKTSTSVSRSWVYTLNNYTEEELNMFKNFIVKYQVIGYEKGDNGTPHLQGYVTFIRGYRLPALKKLCPRAHWEIAKTADAANYCLKSHDIPPTIIDNRHQGDRTDLKKAIHTLKEEGFEKLVNEFPTVVLKYPRGVQVLENSFLSAKPKPVPIVTWIYGATGTGKTRYVVEKESDLWISGEDLHWFDGYKGQKAALIDDFRGDMCKFRFLLRILDRYPLQVPVKGGFTWWIPERIYITSCKHPKDVYNKESFDNEEKVDQLLRRINDIIYK